MTKPQAKPLHPWFKFESCRGFPKTDPLLKLLRWEDRLRRMVPLCEWREAPAGSEDDTDIFPERLSTEKGNFFVGNARPIDAGYDQWTSLFQPERRLPEDDIQPWIGRPN